MCKPAPDCYLAGLTKLNDVRQHEQLLMMRPTVTHPHVQQALAARGHDSLPQSAVLLQAEPEPVQVRAPQQAAHDDPPAGCLGQHP